MSDINAGVVLVTKFVSASSTVFSGYIDYINRSNAVRNENIDKYTIPTLDREIKQYNEYMEYMGDAKKTTELFTNKKDRLTIDEKDQLKDIFQMAQDNGSLMWQSVISFDNKWLSEAGLYDSESGVLNEFKLKEYTRLAVNAMLDKEGMTNNCIWSASIHYNTDNIHIHIATVQPVPTREKKTIKTIRFNSKWLSEKIGNEFFDTLNVGSNIKAHGTKNKNYADVLKKIKDEIFIETGKSCKLGDYMQLNLDGSLDISYYGENSDIPYMAQLQSEEQVQKGVFKESSIETAKSRMVNKILNHTQINDKINTLMRDTLIDDFKNIDIENHDLKKLYLDIYKSLPKNKRLWQYNTNVMSPLHNNIDRFTTEWLKQYHRNDFEKLQEYLSEQQEMYQTAYGGKNNNFAENKIKDLYSRCGNIILKNFKELANSDIIDIDEIELPEPDFIETDYIKDELNNEKSSASDNSLSEEEITDYLSCFEETTFLEFSEKYKKAKQALYGTKQIAPDHQLAFNLLEEEAQAGNAYAIHDLANCYTKDLGCTANSIISSELYKRALQTFKDEISNIEKSENISKKQQRNLSYLNYRVGKMYYYGQGNEVDKQKAFEYFTNSTDNIYSVFYLAKFYENGEPKVVEKDLEKSFDYYSTVCEIKEMPYAYYKRAYMLENGLGTNVDKESSQNNYKTALSGFIDSIEKRPDDFLYYRIGQMYITGKGCDINIEEGIKFLELSCNGGNDMAACALAKLYCQNKNDPAKIKKAFELLHRSADKNNNVQAQYNLGKLYMENEDIEQSLKYFNLAAKQGNQFAQYKLGNYYLKQEDLENGIKYLSDSAKQGNQYAQYRLGVYYFDNNKVEEGIKFLHDAAKQNNSFAQYKLGKYYLDNDETEKGIEFLSSAAEQNNDAAKYKLGSYYLKNGDIQKGADYLIDLADKGNAFASMQLGNLYSQADYYDFKQAEKYYLQAVGKGIITASYNLGVLYLSDRDNIRHCLKGIEYLNMAAEQGNQYALYQLGKVYFYGNKFISPDGEKAQQYLYAAAAKGHKGAEYLLNKRNTHKTHKKHSLPHFHLPYELNHSLHKLISELGRDYRNRENILNQIAYEKLQSLMDEERE